MVKKEEILQDLNGYLCTEEDIINSLVAFLRNLGWKSVVSSSEHEKIEQGLLSLRRDTEKHAQMIKDMIIYVEASGKNEF